MAQPEPKRWLRAALGGLLVALGGALFGAVRGGRVVSGSKGGKPPAGKAGGQGAARASGRRGAASRPKIGRSNVRTKPRPAEVPMRTRHWPPPAPTEPEHHGAERQQPQDQLPVDGQSEKLGYETRDTKAGTIVGIMAFAVTMIAISIASLFWFIGHSHREDARTSPLTPQQLAVIVPPGPHLQDHPLHDIAMEKKREADLLTVYAWADASHRAARIPIARAQALVIGRPLDPLPVVAPAAPAAKP